MENQTQTRAVLFADVSGSVHLYESLGDGEALACVTRCLSIMRDATLGQGGRVVRTIGDELLCVFDDATAAARAAAAMQALIACEEPVRGERLAIRVGAHFGPLIERSDDVFGDIVNVAARMASLAKAGQFLTTRPFVESLPDDLRAGARCLNLLPVKGKEREVEIYELVAERTDDLTTLATHTTLRVVRLRLRHNARDVVVGPELATLSFGRDPANDFPIQDRMASRQHARIERHRHTFVLVDMSSNGTYVTFDGQEELVVRREQTVLHGRGSISFGHRRADDPAEVVVFELEG